MLIIHEYCNQYKSFKHFPIRIRFPHTRSLAFQSLEKAHFIDELFPNAEYTRMNKMEFPLHLKSFLQGDKRYELHQKIQEGVAKLIGNYISPGKFSNEVKIVLMEIMNNAADHSFTKNNIKGVADFSQRSNTLFFCIQDDGQGFKESFLSHPDLRESYVNLTDSDCLLSALNLGISCNPAENKNPKYSIENAGQGLYMMKILIENHEDCDFIIISRKGCIFTKKDGKIDQINLPFDVKRTFIFCKIKMYDNFSSQYRSVFESTFPRDEEDEGENIMFID